MDEVEAALDDVNLHRFLGLVDEFRDDAQLIIVSHQKRTMEAADCLYGVTMQPGGSSRVVSEKVPRDRTAVDTLVPGPTTKSTWPAVAPAEVPELDGEDASGRADGSPTGAEADGAEIVDDVDIGDIGEDTVDAVAELDVGDAGVADAGPTTDTDRTTADTDEDGSTDGTDEAGSLNLAELLEQPPRQAGPGIPVPPPRGRRRGAAARPDADR